MTLHICVDPSVRLLAAGFTDQRHGGHLFQAEIPGFCVSLFLSKIFLLPIPMKFWKETGCFRPTPFQMALKLREFRWLLPTQSASVLLTGQVCTLFVRVAASWACLPQKKVLLWPCTGLYRCLVYRTPGVIEPSAGDWHLSWCVCYFSTGVVKLHDQGHLYTEGFLWAHSSKGKRIQNLVAWIWSVQVQSLWGLFSF